MSHEFGPRLFGKVQGHWDKCKIRVRFIFFLWRNIESSYFTQKLLMVLMCVRVLTQSHLGKFKVTKRTSAKLDSGSYLHIFLWRNVLTSYKKLLMTWGRVITWSKVILAISRSLLHKSIIPVYVIFCNGKLLEAIIWYKVCLWPFNMSWPWALVICAKFKFKVTVRKMIHSLFSSRKIS